jgi:hypothetical protein
MNPTQRLVSLLLVLQLVSSVYLWTITTVSAPSAGRFALFLAIDLLSFAIVAYVYTRDKWGEAISRVWILAGSIGLIILLISSLYFA